MSQFIKFPTSEPLLESLCYPCRRRAERSRAAMPGLSSSEPGLAGLLPSLLPWADVFCPQILQKQALAARLNVNKYIYFHRRDGREELLFPAVPCLWHIPPCTSAPGKLHPIRVPGGFPGRRYGPREGAAAWGCTPRPTPAKYAGVYFIPIYF